MAEKAVNFKRESGTGIDEQQSRARTNMRIALWQGPPALSSVILYKSWIFGVLSVSNPSVSFFASQVPKQPYLKQWQEDFA
jgi:hypothetical protein